MNKDDLKSTRQAIERVHTVCSREIGVASQASAEISMLYQCTRWGSCYNYIKSLKSFPTRLNVSARVEKKAISLYVVMQLTVCVKAIP